MRRNTLGPFSFLPLVLAMLVGAGAITHAAAQDATPAPGAQEFPLTADPALCTVEPRTTEELLDLWFPPDGTPVAENAMAQEPPTEVTIPLGEPIDDDAIRDQITTTVHEVFSCFAAGDFPRATAHFTDDLVQTFGPELEMTREDVEAFLEAPPMPEAEEEQTRILAITDVMLLDDGRIGAFAVDEIGTAFVIFEEQADGRMLVDEVIEFTSVEDDAAGGGGAGGVSEPGDD